MVLRSRGCSKLIQGYSKTKSNYEAKIFSYCHRQHLSNIVPVGQKLGFFKEKIEELVKFYDEFTGMDEVRKAQNRVLEKEEHFRSMQEKRRSIVNELRDIQGKLKDVYAELDVTNRGEDRYVHLVTLEHKLLKEEKAIIEKFSNAEKDERDSFTDLSSTVKLSHEKERAQRERTKYWSIIGSVVGTVIGIVGTTINNHFRINHLKELIENSSNSKIIENLDRYLENNEKLLEQIRNFDSSKINHKPGVEDLLKTVDSRLCNVEVSLKNIEEQNKSNVYADSQEGSKVVIPVDSLTETMKKEYSQTKVLLFALAVLSVLMPIVTRYS